MKIYSHPENPSELEMIDSDKLPDMDALVIEKLEELRQLCYDANYRCLLLVQQKYNRTVKTGIVINNIEDGISLCDVLKECILESI